MNYNTKHLQNTCKFLSTLVQLIQGSFGYTHTFTHTLSHAHPTRCLDYKVTPYNLPMHTSVRKVPGLTRSCRVGAPLCSPPILSLCCLRGFQEGRLCGHPYVHLLLACRSLSPSHAVPMISRTTPADM